MQIDNIHTCRVNVALIGMQGGLVRSACLCYSCLVMIHFSHWVSHNNHATFSPIAQYTSFWFLFGLKVHLHIKSTSFLFSLSQNHWAAV